VLRKGKGTSKGLKDERIMTWPPLSPDLNTIEILWALYIVFI